MSDLYQLRKDIDTIYNQVFDFESGQLNVASKEELNEVIEKLNGYVSLELLETNLSTLSGYLDDYANGLTFNLIETITESGATAKIYANNTFVYIKYSGTVSLTANTNLNMGTLSDTSYAPIDYEYAPINHVGSDISIYGAVNESGIVYVINDSSRTSVDLHGGILYPLTSRLNEEDEE